MEKNIVIIGAGLAGSEAALQLAARGHRVRLIEMRPVRQTAVHRSAHCAELVCSNSLKSTKSDSAAGMLKRELRVLGSCLYGIALENAVAAGGALAVDRDRFAAAVTRAVVSNELVDFQRREVVNLRAECADAQAVIVATGPLTSDALAASIARATGSQHLAFYDAAAPIVMADSLDEGKLFRQNRYEGAPEGAAESGDYLNAAFNKEQYDRFIDELVAAERVVAKDFETRDLFQACQPIEEIARKGHDAPRFGTLKPVGLTDPSTGRRPWAALQLRAENVHGSAYNLVGFQTNLTFPEQRRVFRMIPGLENAEFARYGVMHRNTFIDAPQLLDSALRLKGTAAAAFPVPLFVAGQLAGTEGYCEAIRSGLHAAISASALVQGIPAPKLPLACAFGALLDYATNPATSDYQPMHVNFGIMTPLDHAPRNKRERYAAYAERGARALDAYRGSLVACGLLPSVLLGDLSGKGDV
ncbi:methylenetetrahydrofolate--tRNA-(uracil(54)-C(5))-methyltransferase (FADH(2)-oxidizing) TrmFO [Adlercreutzia sp. ZJ141]|uniref:methylenetetrahydrofolate--tRNA-(uracil(54)- C(5))-methyltransferase (FADH(2)-oxidizing) TrmFO n=1 Tax=Adlercreutzia sp. ZJ141 TaxID=2709406 RepID=UPI0013EDB8EA|nr:methylenetetrahydrofolate--tRNA-(uracil(54)-C(5))-methyltransferase (FADH(2)-oxidizing) TrmFO [Adlercreutzia sp. ZJ141]